ncbi:uncharacterized protein N7503_004129 [Penicillium pulvis]|uniref:uncharacterized protein n=1 Tax=Penicillium pulvis TaxID=1562058 RepID=UPI0025497FBD|nr:uncharacterized protein N7503_004129 [Penicillium pulvis]KAJ5806527.1 hypothetical protein N7503_004129 [Penicillium pulvis]
MLTSLPLELLSTICSNLQLSDWKALRLSNHALYEITLDKFANRYFKKIQFIATSESLRELEGLAESDAICERVRELWMIPQLFEGLGIRREERRGHLAMSSRSPEPIKGEELKARYAIYKSMVTDSSDLLESESFSIRLSKCLERFVNVDTIGLAYYPTTYLLDPRQQKVRFLGWRHMINQIDFQFHHDRLSMLHRDEINGINSLALSRLLGALISSTRTGKIRKLHTHNADFFGRLSPKITLGAAQYNTLLSSVLDELEDLHICFAFARSIGPFAPNPPDIFLEGQTWLNLLIKVGPRLQILSYSQDCDYGQRLLPDYFWLLTLRMQLTRLKELHLHQVYVTSELLKGLITGVKETLTVFTLFEVRVVDDDERTGDYLEPRGVLGAAESLNTQGNMEAQTPDTQQNMGPQDTLDAQESRNQDSPPNKHIKDSPNHPSASPTSPTAQLTTGKKSPIIYISSPIRREASSLYMLPAQSL